MMRHQLIRAIRSGSGWQSMWIAKILIIQHKKQYYRSLKYKNYILEVQNNIKIISMKQNIFQIYIMNLCPLSAFWVK